MNGITQLFSLFRPLAVLLFVFAIACSEAPGEDNLEAQNNQDNQTDLNQENNQEEEESEEEQEPTALDLFVEDNSDFEYEVVWSESAMNVDTWLLDVTSQNWRSSEEVDRTLWKHEVVLAMPQNSSVDTALVVITGGRNRDSLMEPSNETVTLMRLLANLSGTPVVGIAQIPNQPLTILGEDLDKTEDDLVSASWHKVLETGDPTWSAYFPMTRGVIRIMDAVQDLAADQEKPIENFVVTGYSKRGATTFLVAVADERVIAMAPGVFDFLNFRPQAQHHLDVYGEPAPAVAPYARYNLLERVQLPEADVLVETSDPYAYRERMTMPKLIMASPGDQFFLPDAMHFYIDEIPGETLVRYLPNTDHGLVPPGGNFLDAIDPLLNWYGRIVEDQARPELSWTHEEGRLTVVAEPAPEKVNLWEAVNPEARNFRYDVVGAIWESRELVADEEGDFVAEVEAPAEGYKAYFVEALFGEEIYTTQVYVTAGE